MGKWLIDTLVAYMVANYPVLTGSFVNRGDPAAYDYTLASFILDNTWRSVGYPPVVLVAHTAVLLSVDINSPGPLPEVMFRRRGNVNAFAVTKCASRPLHNLISFLVTVPKSDVQGFDYNGDAASITTLNITIVGWWV